MMMSKIKYVETNVPKNIQVRVHYLQQGKVEGMPKNVKRVTIASLVDTTSGERVAEATAFCNNNDNDSRKIGRAIAVGRALKSYYQAQA